MTYLLKLSRTMLHALSLVLLVPVFVIEILVAFGFSMPHMVSRAALYAGAYLWADWTWAAWRQQAKDRKPEGLIMCIFYTNALAVCVMGLFTPYAEWAAVYLNIGFGAFGTWFLLCVAYVLLINARKKMEERRMDRFIRSLRSRQ